MKDTHLLPYILPNVFAIAQILSPTQFGSLVLPSLKPLFAVKEPPQNMLTLLDNLNLLQTKSDKAVFRERVLSCSSELLRKCEANDISNSRSRCSSPCIQRFGIRTCRGKFRTSRHDGKHAEDFNSKVQERALRVVPDLCESIDYAEVQGVLFPRVAVGPRCSLFFYIHGLTGVLKLVFTKTTNLSVKVSTLQTFLAMVKTLDQV